MSVETLTIILSFCLGYIWGVTTAKRIAVKTINQYNAVMNKRGSTK